MKIRHNVGIALLVFVAFGIVSLRALNPEPRTPNPETRSLRRPPIVGVAHIGLKTDDLNAARKFYGEYLGFQEPFTVDKPGGGLMLTYFKVNDHQYIEVFPSLKSPNDDRLSHIAFETTDIRRLLHWESSSTET